MVSYGSANKENFSFETSNNGPLIGSLDCTQPPIIENEEETIINI